MNLIGVYLAIKHSARVMVPKGKGSIICTASVAGVRSGAGPAPYSASKAGVINLVQTSANFLYGTGVRVNAISPGHIDTSIFDTWQQGDALTRMKEDLAKTVPLGRLGDPDEIAKTVAFLASDEASYISGVELFVDGGVAQI